MAENMPDNSGSKLARSILKEFGEEADLVKVRMRSGRDVYTFVRKVEESHRKAGRNLLSFD